MKTAKKHNKIFAILCTIISAVFAIYIGVTYCGTFLVLEYGSNPNSTSAYFANQQYHLINDTLKNPIIYGEGAHDFEIALEYSMPYDFDVKITYSFTCSDTDLKDNIILNFSNRDNVIYDEQTILLANSVAAGNGKITFINGLEFVDLDNESFYGDTVKINASVELCKAQSSYDVNHRFKTEGEAFTMWLHHKNKAATSNNYVMMYNYRRDFNHGVEFPGLNSAYKKTMSNGSVQTASWAGGNRAYAGVGMYVVTGNKGLTLDILVGGQWRNATNTQEVDNKDGKLISENCIKFNYTSNWLKRTSNGYDAAKLWEVRDFNIDIPAQTSCYIEILDSIEITRATISSPNISQEYRAVVEKIELHSKSDKKTEFIYSGLDASEAQIQLAQVNEDAPETIITGTVDGETISIFNSSIYNPGLYTSDATNGHDQNFTTNVVAINNTDKTQNVTAKYKIYYLVSNAQDGFYNNTTDKLRVDEVYPVVDGDEASAETSRFSSTYAYSKTQAYSTELVVLNNIVIAPYSSVNIIDKFTVGLDLQTGKLTTGNDRYDAWVYVVVEEISSSPINTTTIADISLQIQTKQDGNSVQLFVKNNTNKIISDITANNVIIYETDVVDASSYTAIGNTQPSDWKATYWKHYTLLDGVYSQNLSSTFDSGKTYYLKNQGVTNITPDLTNLTGLTLNPGESKLFATATTRETKKIRISGNLVGEATLPEEVIMIEDGTLDARIYNPTENSYYIRFKGTISLNEENADINENIVASGNYNYYIGILRPGQILNVPMTAVGNIVQGEKQLDAVEASGDFDADTTLAGWDTAEIEKYFAIDKT